MRKNIFNLCSKMLELIKVQRNALLEGRFEEVLALQERRQNIIDKIQNIDSEVSFIHPANSATGKNDHVREDFSQRISTTVEEILSLDREMRTVIQSELDSLTEKLHIIQKAKAFCHNASPHQTGNQVHISV